MEMKNETMFSIRWATQGLEFIALACEPKNIVYLSDNDFQVSEHIGSVKERKKEYWDTLLNAFKKKTTKNYDKHMFRIYIGNNKIALKIILYFKCKSCLSHCY